jgi:SAM-dependent methyltransferase
VGLLDAAAPAQFAALAGQFDTVICVNVLEHIEDDAVALAAMAAILSPGGVIVLLVPAFAALFGPIDRNLGHYRRYRRDEIARLARAAGLEIAKLHYMNVAGFVGWWVNARLLKRESQSDRQIAIFDRWMVPVLSALEGAIPPPFGQSLLAVLRRPVGTAR